MSSGLLGGDGRRLWSGTNAGRREVFRDSTVLFSLNPGSKTVSFLLEKGQVRPSVPKLHRGGINKGGDWILDLIQRRGTLDRARGRICTHDVEGSESRMADR